MQGVRCFHPDQRLFYCLRTKTVSNNCEIVLVKVDIVSAKSLFVAAYYRPKEGDIQSTEKMRRSLDMVTKTQGNVWILGNFNYPKFSWDAEHKPSIKLGCGFTYIYDDFVTMLDNFGLVQMVP